MDSTSKILTRPLPDNYQARDEKMFAGRQSVVLNCQNLIPKHGSFYYSNAHGLFDWTGKVFKPSMAYVQELAVMTRPFFWSRFIAKKKNYITQPCIIISNKSTRNYYHWHADILPKLVNAKKSSHYRPDLAIAIHEKFLALEFVREGLRMFWPGPVLALKEDHVYWFKTLYFADAAAPHTSQDPDLLPVAIQTILAAQPAGSVNTDRTLARRRIYIKRGEAAQKKRRIINEAELLAALAAIGYEAVEFENLSYQEQMQLCSQCEAMISINGAGLTNAIFMPPQAAVLEIRSNALAPLSFWSLANICGHRYLYYIAARDENGPKDHVGSLIVDIPEFMAMLRKHIP